MKFSIGVLLTLSSAAAFSPVAFRPTTTNNNNGLVLHQSTEVEQDEKAASKKENRLRMMKSDQFHRKGFKEVRDQVEGRMVEEYESSLVKDLRTSNYVMDKDGVKVYLAKDFGFCWGVERSIALAYEAVDHFPDRKIHITNELIHNPEVNDKLDEMNVQFIEKVGDGEKNFETVQEGDVVILPAFGASYEEMDYFDKKVGQ